MRLPHAKLWAGVTFLMLAAASLFSVEVALFTLTGRHIFPYAAPTGGSLLILSWLIVTGLAVAGWLRNC
jgi:uncharacterized membrane protein YgdD (TMEM256/DUF423 family)